MTGQREVAMSDQPSGRFGPQTAHVEAFLVAVRGLTEAESESIAAARKSAWGAAWAAARKSAWGAAWAAARVAAWDAAWYAASAAARDAARYAAWDAPLVAARNAALALVVADLVGQYGLTRAHLDTLVAPCRTVPRLAKIIDAALADSVPEAVAS